MPVIVPRKAAPIVAAQPAEQAATALSRADVDAMLAARDAAWQRQIQTITQAFGEALKAIGQQPQKPAAGWDFKVEYRQNGAIETIRATPRK
jgi:hypothetical protein